MSLLTSAAASASDGTSSFDTPNVFKFCGIFKSAVHYSIFRITRSAWLDFEPFGSIPITPATSERRSVT